MKRMRKFLRLTATDQRLLLRAAFILGAIRLGLWLVPFQTLRRFLARLMQVPTGLPKPGQYFPDRVGWAVAVASQYIPGTRTCLIQALAGQVLLEQEGYSTQFRIGVTLTEGKDLKAHAWVESLGRVVIGGSGHERYTPLPGLERDGS